LWKKPARLTDYRQPTLFARDLLKQHPQSNFIVDARHGFEDDPADVEWGFSELLPSMAETDCSCVAFILEKLPAIEKGVCCFRCTGKIYINKDINNGNLKKQKFLEVP